MSGRFQTAHSTKLSGNVPDAENGGSYHAGYADELENRADGAVRGTSSGTGADCYGD